MGYMSKVGLAAQWLEKYLVYNGKTDSRTVKHAGFHAGHHEWVLLRAMHKLNGKITGNSYTYWELDNE